MLSTVRKPLTVPVCDRCRQRRQKCDQSLAGCGPCIDAKIECTFHDPENGNSLPRAYVQQLEEKLTQLLQSRSTSHNASSEGSASGLIPAYASDLRLDEPGRRFLGDSSGLFFIRAAVELARDQGILRADSSEETHFPAHSPILHSLTCLVDESTSHIWPSVAEAQMLYDVFNRTQFQGEIVSQAEFDEYQHTFAEVGSQQATRAGAALRMIFAIAMFVIGANESSSLAGKSAESYYEHTLGLLPQILPVKDLVSLQIVLLILKFSLANPKKPIVWHLLGYALRLSASLGLHRSDGLDQPAQVTAAINLRRRLFWAVYSIDRAVGNTLGRPTGLQDRDISVDFPVDGSDSERYRIMNLSFRLRQLQSEAADVLYQQIIPIRPGFVAQMQEALDLWMSDVSIGTFESSVRDWFNHAYYNFCMFIHRPSVAIAIPSSADLQRCYEASSGVLTFYWKMNRSKTIDTTWMAAHWLFLAAITHLYCIWVDEDIRNSLDWTIVYRETQSTSMILSAMAERVSSAQRMPQIYHDLCVGTFRKYGELYPHSDDDSDIIP